MRDDAKTTRTYRLSVKTINQLIQLKRAGYGRDKTASLVKAISEAHARVCPNIEEDGSEKTDVKTETKPVEPEEKQEIQKEIPFEFVQPSEMSLRMEEAVRGMEKEQKRRLKHGISEKVVFKKAS